MPFFGTVSIVDDNEASRLAIANLVRSLGWQTLLFDSAEAYLSRRSLAGLDGLGCLISDVRMPGMSGIELHEQLLASGDAPPTIFVTAFTTEALRTRVTANGALALLKKPIDTHELQQCLERAMVKRG
ncbi:response regulator [Paraburkholderia sp. NMBU_R16]|uniref:response regulator transcription factor n=1 Tax=Paraburkholderia sp. NMBU_R16 TaxID=2698676 RepID=UPI001565BC7C|nr:response regulator [Paraburkholderia sp. NMBU_R16]NRO97939.1 response regulator [Paraburkholderia sp. NMBU_R16]